MLFQITHTTLYSYDSPVAHSLNEVRLVPRKFAGQTVQSSSIRVQPEPAFMHYRTDYYGNDAASFEIFEKHDHLEITAESVVEAGSAEAGLRSSISWEDAR